MRLRTTRKVVLGAVAAIMILTCGSLFAQQDMVAQQHGGSALIPGAQMILVQPNVIYNASGGNDLEQLRGYFRGSNWEWGISPEAWAHLSRLGVDRFRIINIEGNNYVEDTENPGEYRFEPSGRLVNALDNCETCGVMPHVIFGMAAQQAISNITEDGRHYGVSDWPAYERYAYLVLKYLLVERDFDEIYVEIGNEPDINGTGWLVPESQALGSPILYEAYFELYRAWAHAAAKFSRDYPNEKLHLGGPDLTQYTFALSDFNWYERFTEQVAEENLRLDFLSFHYYGNGGAIKSRDDFGPFNNFTEHVRIIRRFMHEAGLDETPLYMTEWGPSWITDDSNPNGVINNNHVGAAHNAAFLTDMLANRLDMALSLVFRNHGHYPDAPYVDNWGWPGYLTRDSRFRTVTYNVFDMFCRLPGQRVECSRGSGSIGAFSAGDTQAKQIGVIVYNYDWDYPNAREGAQTEPVYIRIQRMPYEAENLHVRQYLIDADHSDAYGLLQKGIEFTDENTKLQLIDEYTIDVVHGDIGEMMAQLPVFDMPPSSVSLWLIQAE